MTFKTGEFFVITGEIKGETRFLGLKKDGYNHNARRQISNIRSKAGMNPLVDLESRDQEVTWASDPWTAGTWASDAPIEELIYVMRLLRAKGGRMGLDGTTIRLEKLSVQVQTYAPDPQSSDADQIRRFALDKLTPEERDLLNLTHWDVYDKLSWRPPDDDDDDDVPF